MPDRVLVELDGKAGGAVRAYQQAEQAQQKFLDQSKKRTRQTAASQADQVRRLGFSLQRFGVQGTAAFGEIFAAIGPVGIALGALTLGVVTLNRAFINMARAGVNAFTQLINQSRVVAQEIEEARAQFTAFFQGDARLAEAAMERIEALSLRLGQNVTGLFRAFLPEADSLQQVDALVNAAVALTRVQPEQGIGGARIALQDLLSGNITPLIKRFEVPRDVGREIQEALDTEGAGAAIETLQQWLDDTGRGVEALADTAQVAFGRIQELFRQFQGIVGEPVLDALKEEFNAVFEIILDGREDVDRMGGAIGQFAAQGIRALGELARAITTAIVDNADDIEALFMNLRDSASILEAFLEITTGDGDEFSGWMEELNGTLENVNQTLERSVAIVSILYEVMGPLMDLYRASREVTDAMSLSLGDFGAFLITGEVPVVQEIGTAFRALQDLENGLREDGFIDMADALDRINEAFAAHDERANAAAEAQDNLSESMAASEEAVNSFLSGRSGEEGFAEDALEDIQKMRDAFSDHYQGIREDIEDHELGIKRDREDLRRDSLDALEDLERDHLLRLDDAYEDFLEEQVDDRIRHERDLEDIMIDFARRERDLAREVAEERAEIEEDLARKLAEINRRYDFRQRQAIRDQDAVAFVRLNEQRDFDLNEARIDAQSEADEAIEEAERKRDELNRLLQEELQDAERANARRVEDTIRSYQRENAEIQERYEEELQALRIKEARKREELQLSWDRQMEDLNTRWDRRLATLQEKYQEEIALTHEFMAQQIRQWVSFNRSMSSMTSRRSSRPGGGGSAGFGTGSAGFGNTTIDELRSHALDLAFNANRTDLINAIKEGTRGTLLNIIASLGGSIPRKRGGPVFPGRNYLFEGHAEILSFSRNGSVIPLEDMMRFSPPDGSGRPTSGGTMVSIEQKFDEPGRLPPETVAMVKSMMLDVVSQVFNEAST